MIFRIVGSVVGCATFVGALECARTAQNYAFILRENIEEQRKLNEIKEFINENQEKIGKVLLFGGIAIATANAAARDLRVWIVESQSGVTIAKKPFSYRSPVYFGCFVVSTLFCAHGYKRFQLYKQTRGDDACFRGGSEWR